MPWILKTAMLVNGIAVPIPATEGLVSHFGGPGDTEWVSEFERDWFNRFRVRHLGTPKVRSGDPYYIAMNWFDSNDPPVAFKDWTNDKIKRWYCEQKVVVVREDKLRAVVCWVADSGPGIKKRACDVGPEVLGRLGIETDKKVFLGWVDPKTHTGPYRLEGAGTDHAHFVRDDDDGC